MDLVGQQLGNYDIVEYISSGGYADVYRAENRYSHRNVAIKFLKAPNFMPDEQDAFLKEARTLTRLTHKHIVHVDDFGIYHNPEDSLHDRPYIIMTYAPKGSLRTAYPEETQVPLDKIVLYINQIGEALQYAHNQQQAVVHCDVKPENMLRMSERDILLSDFGIARDNHKTLEFPDLDDPRISIKIFGSSGYLAPERCRGLISRASDQYALGIVAYEWLTGVRPFTGSNISVMLQHINNPPPPIPDKRSDISHEVESVVMRAISKEAKDRYPTVKDFADALQDAASPILHPTRTHARTVSSVNNRQMPENEKQPEQKAQQDQLAQVVKNNLPLAEDDIFASSTAKNEPDQHQQTARNQLSQQPLVEDDISLPGYFELVPEPPTTIAEQIIPIANETEPPKQPMRIPNVDETDAAEQTESSTRSSSSAEEETDNKQTELPKQSLNTAEEETSVNIHQVDRSSAFSRTISSNRQERREQRERSSRRTASSGTQANRSHQLSQSSQRQQQIHLGTSSASPQPNATTTIQRPLRQPNHSPDKKATFQDQLEFLPEEVRSLLDLDPGFSKLYGQFFWYRLINRGLIIFFTIILLLLELPQMLNGFVALALGIIAYQIFRWALQLVSPVMANIFLSLISLYYGFSVWAIFDRLKFWSVANAQMALLFSLALIAIVCLSVFRNYRYVKQRLF